MVLGMTKGQSFLCLLESQRDVNILLSPFPIKFDDIFPHTETSSFSYNFIISQAKSQPKRRESHDFVVNRRSFGLFFHFRHDIIPVKAYFIPVR